jgi:ABC-type transport system involved in multi-copper enzyme maturation permease subunit
MNINLHKKLGTTFTMVAVGFFLLLINVFDFHIFGGKEIVATVSIIAGMPLIFVGVGRLFVAYLTVDHETSDFDTSNTIKQLSQQVRSLTAAVDLITEIGSGKNNSEGISTSFDQLLKEKLNSESIINTFQTLYGEQAKRQVIAATISDDYKAISNRIEIEILRLSKSARVNLTYGGLSTLLAIALIGLQVYLYQGTFASFPLLLSYYIPRLTIVIFIEIFAFFFLKIYKSTLAEIKYFHNEKTNIELKVSALKIAILSDNGTGIEHAIKSLADTERNFVLKKDESTIELEKSKLELQSSTSIINALKDVINRGK